MGYRHALAAAALSMLAACGSQEPEAGGVTADESRQLNEAAEMLDVSPDSLTAEDTELGNGEGEAVESGGGLVERNGQ